MIGPEEPEQKKGERICTFTKELVVKTFWFFMYVANPGFLLLGMSGALGDEAKEAADEYAEAMAIPALIILVVVVIVLLIGAVAH